MEIGAANPESKRIRRMMSRRSLRRCPVRSLRLRGIHISSASCSTGERLTLCLRQPGAPLDNNICERALKKAILHRKNSLFYKTENGARVGDLFMSLIHTCELCGANPFDYLTQLQRHAAKLARNPSPWMPWNYRETLPRSGVRVDSG